MKRIIILFCFVIFFIYSEEKLNWKDTKIITEDLAPLGYIDKKDNKFKGETAEKIQSALKYLGISNKIEIYPWARAINMAKNEKDIFIFNLARTPEREKEFKWVYKMNTKKIGIFALKTKKDIVIKSILDIKKYKIVVLNQNIVHLALLEKGFDKVNNLYFHPMSNESQIIQFLYEGRADIWIKTYLNSSEMDEKIREVGENPDNLRLLFELKELKTDLYLAASLNTDDKKIEKFREALEQTNIVEK